MISYNPTDPDIEGKKQYDIMRGFGTFSYFTGFTYLIIFGIICLIALFQRDGILVSIFYYPFLIGFFFLLSAGKHLRKRLWEAVNKTKRAYFYWLVISYIILALYSFGILILIFSTGPAGFLLFIPLGIFSI